MKNFTTIDVNDGDIIECAKQRFKVCANYENEARLVYLKDLSFSGYVKRNLIMRILHRVSYKLFPNWYIYHFGYDWQWDKRD